MPYGQLVVNKGGKNIQWGKYMGKLDRCMQNNEITPYKRINLK